MVRGMTAPGSFDPGGTWRISTRVNLKAHENYCVFANPCLPVPSAFFPVIS